MTQEEYLNKFRDILVTDEDLFFGSREHDLIGFAFRAYASGNDDAGNAFIQLVEERISEQS